MEVYRELSIRVKTNCGFSTLPDLPEIYTNPYERQKHPYQRRFLSFYFLILCSYANYSSSYRNIEHLTYKVVPGEWICSLKELQIHFRQKFQHQVISILDTLVEQNLLTYSLHEKIRLSNTRSKTGQKIILPFPIITHAKKTSGFSFSNRRCS